jgi:SAM-dependent methyltransferase
MLEMVRSKAREPRIAIAAVQANLCRLGCFPDAAFDYALSMFSTLGMIRGRESRRRALFEARRILRPGGRIALHAHNFWLNLRNPQGRSWLWSQAWGACFDRSNLGDRRMTYRGIHEMKVHLYRWGELKRELRAAGFWIDDVVALDEVSAEPIRAPWMAHSLRAGGWIVFAVRR